MANARIPSGAKALSTQQRDSTSAIDERLTQAEQETLAFASLRMKDMAFIFSKNEKKSENTDDSILESIIKISLWRTGFNHSYHGYGFFHDLYARDGNIEKTLHTKNNKNRELLKLTMIDAVNDKTSAHLRIPVNRSIREKESLLPPVYILNKEDIKTKHGCYDAIYIDNNENNTAEMIGALGVLGGYPDIDEQLDIISTFSHKVENFLFHKIDPLAHNQDDTAAEFSGLPCLLREMIKKMHNDIATIREKSRSIPQIFYAELLQRLTHHLILPEIYDNSLQHRIILSAWKRLILLSESMISCILDNKNYLTYLEFIFDEAILINAISSKNNSHDFLSSSFNFELKNYNLAPEMHKYMQVKAGGSAMGLLSDMAKIFLSPHHNEDFSAMLQSKLYYEISCVFKTAIHADYPNRDSGSELHVYTKNNVENKFSLEIFNIENNGKTDRSASNKIDVIFCGFRENFSFYFPENTNSRSSRIKMFQTCDVFFLIGEQLHLRKKESSSKKLIIVIDNTINADEELAEIISWYGDEIRNGILAILTVRSLNKYFHLGLDKLPSGLITGFFEPNCFPELKTYFNNININSVNMTYDMVAFQMNHCMDLYDRYVNKIKFNSRIIHDVIITSDQISQSFDSHIIIFSPYTDSFRCDVSGFLLIQAKADNKAIAYFEHALCMNGIYPRDGYGFSESTFIILKGENILYRISVGIEDHDILVKKFEPVILWISYINLLTSILNGYSVHMQEKLISDLAWHNDFYLPKDKIYIKESKIYFGEKGTNIRNIAYYAKTYCEVAKAFENGNIVKQNTEMAFQFYARAAQYGSIDALYKLGRLAMKYYQLDGKDQDIETARNAFELAKNKGHSEAKMQYTKYFSNTSECIQPPSLGLSFVSTPSHLFASSRSVNSHYDSPFSDSRFNGPQ